MTPGLRLTPLVQSSQTTVDNELSWGFRAWGRSRTGILRRGVRSGLGGGMDALAAALDCLAEDDLHALAAPELLDRLRELVAARNRLDAELARTVAGPS